jgi:CRISPR-associated protein Csm4
MKIIYLEPQSGFKALLRSDTLWGNICWAIRMVYGEQRLIEYIESQSFTISSTFPYSEMNGQKTPFFPTPLIKGETKSAPEGASYDQLSVWMTQRKKDKKRNTLISKDLFEQLINGIVKVDDLNEQNIVPSIKSEAVTRNKIDRLKGGTYKADGDAGQLFHVDEYHIVGKEENDEKIKYKYGLYFLAQGDTTLLEGALRFLQHSGIGGDRTVGKGVFNISIEEFELKIPTNSNAVTNLSLFAPTVDEIKDFSDKKGNLLNYQVEVREGKLGFLNFKNVEKSPILYFKEGSIFPIIHQKTNYGQNQQAFTTVKLDFKVMQYGIGFMIPIHV